MKHLLYERKYTIEGARRKLKESRGSGELERERRDVVEPAFLAEMRSELQELRALMSPPTQ